ncbi:MAG: polysaccharide deacetylase family protein [Antricoccus sp.]
MTLTFHGAGDPAIAEQILAILATTGASVTVLAVGTWLQANPSIASKIIQGGHELGNHTWTHPDLASLPAGQIASEITQCRDLISQLSGSPGPYFRQSAAQYATPLISTEAGKAGYPTTLSYDIDSLDWTDPGVPAIRSAVAGATAGSIVSMHFGHPQTVSALPAILDDLKSRNLSVVTASTLLAP